MEKQSSQIGYLITPKDQGGKRISYTVSEDNFLPENRNRNKQGPYLIIGFDTEYQGSEETINGQIHLDNEVLSYQYSCSVISSDNEGEELEWNGIILPEGPEVADRLTIKEFVQFAIGHGTKDYPDLKIPRDIFLVAHFTRADVPGFQDFKTDPNSRSRLNFDNIRNTFVNVKEDIGTSLDCSESEEKIYITLKLRDTLHLAPQGANALYKLGEILGFHKIKLADTVQGEKEIKGHMKKLMADNWELFREYAIRDADVCTMYIKHMVRLHYRETNRFQLPLTLTSIGVTLLTQYWTKLKTPLNRLEIVGKEERWRKFLDQKTGKIRSIMKEVYIQKLFWHIDFITDCYHGGRNEQYWFGQAYEDIWNDYDLSSAYPSAMALIGKPDWDNLKILLEDDLDVVLKCDPLDMCFASVNFEFPKSVRFPVLPVRTENGLVFPRKGNATTHVSEILLAHKLGCKLELLEGRYIPTSDQKIFQGFLKGCIHNRNQYEKKTVNNLFWKEIANSTYGKTAQGLRERRVYDLKDDDVKRLEESKITNPCFAAFITAFCRGTLGEIMNDLPDTVNIFSVTTDGFLSNATGHQMEDATQGVMCDNYRRARKALTGDQDIYETKHIIRQPLGWRTRAQATIKPSKASDWPIKPKEDETVVLAKGGIKLPALYEKLEQNEEIVRLFFNREADHIVPMTIGLGIKNMYRMGHDFVDKDFIKRLSMEYDWKRKPFYVGHTPIDVQGVPKSDHIFFSTQPWETVEDFSEVKNCWIEYNAKNPSVIKTKEDFKAFAEYLENKLSLAGEAGKYMKKKNGDIHRLRRDLIRACRFKKAGTHVVKNQSYGKKWLRTDRKITSQVLASYLTNVCGIPCKKTDVDNGRKANNFIKHTTPNTTTTRKLLKAVKDNLFPELEIEAFLAKPSDLNIKPVPLAYCQLSQKMEGPL